MSTTNDHGRWEFDESGNVHYVAPEGGSKQTTDGTYRYAKNQTASTSRKSTKKNNDDWHWLLIVLGFVFWWPIGLVLLFLQISGKWKDSKKTAQEAQKAAAAVKKAAQQFKQGQANAASHATTQNTAEPVKTAPNPAAKKTPKDRKKQDALDAKAYGLGNVKLFRVLGGIMTGLFGFTFIMTLIDEIRYFYSWSWFFEYLTPLAALTLCGVALLCVGGSRKRKLKRFQKYLTMIGNKDTVSITSLAKAMGESEKKVEKDLEEMLERGVLEEGYVDAARRMLVLGGLLEEEPVEKPEPEPEVLDNATATLRRIRSLNDAIANEEVSAKIDRIEEITAKIFRLLEDRPEKAGELRSFMNYYLPQTLKILDNYSKLEAQGIEGENIADGKQKIESIMDKMVDGYESQLDKLFAGDVLDISADLKVMESMMEKDGLTVDNELKF